MQNIQNTATHDLTTQNKFLAIEVNEHGFGVPINSVREIVYHTTINPLPQTPDFVRGVALIRQDTIPVLDLNMLLGGGQATRIHDESCFIVVQLADSSGRLTPICLLADRILQTYKVDSNSVDTPPVIDNEAVVNYVMGVGRIAERIFVLIDPAQLITPFLDAVTPYLTHSGETATDGLESSSEPEITEPNLVAFSRRSNNKYLSVFIGSDEYAFPLSAVLQVFNKSELTDYADKDIPDVLAGAAILDNKPIGVVSLSDVIARDAAEHAATESAAHAAPPAHEKTSREVVVLVDYGDRLFGITVDRIGKTYDNDAELKQNSFCTDLQRKRINSLGFIDNEDGSIEVIDPTGLLTEEERELIDTWMRCIDRIIDMAETRKTAEADNNDSEASSPLARFAKSYLVVQVGKDKLGLDSANVDEVLSYAELLPLKGGPKWFSGLLDLRHNTYPVVDLHIKLDIPAITTSQDDRNVLVMMQYGEQKVGLLVDKILHSTQVGIDRIHGAERSTLVVVPEALHAVADTDQGLVHIIDLPKVMESDELSARHLLEALNKQAAM